MKIITVTLGVPDGTTGLRVITDLHSIDYVLVNARVIREESDIALTRTLEDRDHIIGMTERSAQTIQALADNAEEDRKIAAQWDSASPPIDDDPVSPSIC